MEWDDLKFFLAVARQGSLTKASKEMRTSVSTVSRRLEQLESAIGVSVFAHHQTGYLLTDDGKELLRHATQVEESINKLEINMVGRDSQPEGLVKLATAENLANYLIIPNLGDLHREYPQITLEITTGVGVVSLARHEADIAVRLQRPSQGNVNIKKLGVQGFKLYGSSAYIAQRPDPGQPYCQQTDRLITWSDSFSHLPMCSWANEIRGTTPPVLVTHSLYAQVAAVKAGIGLAMLPAIFSHLDKDIVEVNSGKPLVTQQIWLVVHTDLADSKRVRAVTDFLKRVFHENREVISGGLKH
jgi:DNA-binding transcriptional LysR family regulator